MERVAFFYDKILLMKLVVQRVKLASVKVNNKVIAKIGNGLLVFVGFKKDDLEKNLDWFAEKIIKLRIFSDNEDKMNLSVKDVNGEILLVSQFTLYGDATQNRPSFTESMDFENAEKFYEKFVEMVKLKYAKVQSGVFGAMMEVELINDGPVTIIVEN
mgnify:CR=1 FL=1